MYNIPINVDTIKEGIAQNKREIAKNMLKLSINEKIISESTGLTEEEIKKLK